MSDLEKMRKAQEAIMTETVFIQRLSRISDGAGGWTEVWQSVAQTKGRVATEGGNEVEKGGRITATIHYLISLPANVEIKQDDRLQIGGIQYEITAILDRTGKTATRIIAKRVG